MKRLIIVLLFMVSAPLLLRSQPDTTTVFHFDTFYELVLRNHPVVKQAELLSETARQEVRLARGSFDPKITGNWSVKDFNDTEYYNLLDVSLKIPVWFPVDPVAGIEQNRGSYLNPENYISEGTDNRQLYWGVSIPVGRGLFIDDRRAMVQKALLFQEMAEADQIAEINKILLTAAKDYWNWYNAYRNFELMQRNISVAREIFSRTMLAFQYGEAAAIDTVQAKISLLSRETALREATIVLVRSSLELSNHLWDEEGLPLELTDDLVPEMAINPEIESSLLIRLTEMARESHPSLRKLRIKDESLEVDERLAKENLKPRLDVGYYFLDQPWDATGESSSIEFMEDYKFGINVEFPLFLRKERGKLGQVQVKRLTNSLQQDITERNILNDINARFTTLINLQQLLVQQQQIAEQYELLLQAERLNLENGESDLFKINIQLEKLIEAESKLIKERADFQKELAELYWSAGITNLQL